MPRASKGTYDAIIVAALANGEWSNRYADVISAHRVASGVHARNLSAGGVVRIFRRGEEVFVVRPGFDASTIPALAARTADYNTQNTKRIRAFLESGAQDERVPAESAETAWRMMNTIRCYAVRRKLPMTAHVRGNDVVMVRR